LYLINKILQYIHFNETKNTVVNRNLFFLLLTLFIIFKIIKICLVEEIKMCLVEKIMIVKTKMYLVEETKIKI
jgi:hypothetical protein